MYFLSYPRVPLGIFPGTSNPLPAEGSYYLTGQADRPGG